MTQEQLINDYITVLCLLKEAQILGFAQKLSMNLFKVLKFRSPILIQRIYFILLCYVAILLDNLLLQSSFRLSNQIVNKFSYML